jgi:hypothetical protein
MKPVLVSGALLVGCSVEGVATEQDPSVEEGDTPGGGPVTDAAPPAPDESPPPDAAPPAAPDAGAPLPDLVIMGDELAASIRITQEGFPPDHCAVDECLGGPGIRRLLRFSTGTANLGSVDLVLGRPTPSEEEWEYDACHMHYHYLNFADYELVRANDTSVANGHKRSFCLRDDRMVSPGAGGAVYDCTNQGLSVGWADIYRSSLDCQWIDITGVPAGDYVLRVEINPLAAIPEERLDNNLAEIRVRID